MAVPYVRLTGEGTGQNTVFPGGHQARVFPQFLCTVTTKAQPAS